MALVNLVDLAQSSQVVAIGECGLDRNIDLPLETVETYRQLTRLG